MSNWMKHLSAKEEEVLNLTSQGLTARQIADAMGIRRRTVYFHYQNIYDKFEYLGEDRRVVRAVSEWMNIRKGLK